MPLDPNLMLATLISWVFTALWLVIGVVVIIALGYLLFKF